MFYNADRNLLNGKGGLRNYLYMHLNNLLTSVYDQSIFQRQIILNFIIIKGVIF